MPRWLNLLSFGVSIGGYIFMAIVIVGLVAGGMLVPGLGDVHDVYRPAGDALWNGLPVYSYNYPPYFYAPPWTVLLAVLSRLPLTLEWWLFDAANVAAIWYVADGNWRRMGYLLWMPTIGSEMILGNINLLMAAAIVAAVREGRTALPAALTFAKFAPVVAVDPRKWRQFAIWIALGVAITLPWYWLWPEWIGQMARGFSHPVGDLIPIPFLVRLPFALVLVATRTRLGRALGATLAIPGLYFLSLGTLTAAVSIGLDVLEERRVRRAIGHREVGPPGGSGAPAFASEILRNTP